MDLAAISQQTRISSRYLEAIESGDLEQLPGGFFYRSFVRQYADVLGLDEDAYKVELEQLLEEERTTIDPAFLPDHEPIDVPPIVPEGRSTGDNRLPLYMVLLVAVIIGCSGLYALWQRAQQSPADPIAAAAAPASASVPEPAPPAGSDPAAPPNQAAALTEELPAEAPPPPSDPVAALTMPGPPPAAGLVLEVAASEQVWLSITSDGKQVVSRVLDLNDTRTVQGSETIRMVVGNAGGLAVRVNGRPLGPLGPRGQVRIVEVDSEGARVLMPGRRPAGETQAETASQEI